MVLITEYLYIININLSIRLYPDDINNYETDCINKT